MKVFLDTIGCRLNQSEIESMARQFRAAGHQIVASAEEADLAVINTCAVTSEAAADSRQKIRAAHRLGAQQVIVTGCWATLQPAEAAALPGVTRVVPNAAKTTLVPDLLGLPPEIFDLEPLAREPLPGLHRRTRAFIKVQDGCNNACTFCVTTLARGQAQSRPIPDVLRDIQAALAGGTREIVLTGVHLGSWGTEWSLHLRHLVQAILEHTDVPRLRLSSLEPWDLDDTFFRLWENPRLMPHLHLPLQSGSASVLRRMARKTTPEQYRDLVAAARALIPDVAITTDVIVGFPGETEAEFAETMDFVRQIQFAGGHVFTYSPRPGTVAARMSGQVPPPIRKQRNARLREVFQELGYAYRQRFLGRRMPVLWETISERNDWGWQMEGLTGNYLRVRALAPSPRWNEVDWVALTELTDDGLRGVIVDSG